MLWLRILTVLVLFSPLVCWCDEPDATHIQKLIAGLENEDEQVRGESVRQLGLIGPEARDAIPALIPRFKDRGGFIVPTNPDFPGMGFIEASIRQTSISALKGIGLAAAPALGQALTDDDPDFQLAVLQTLREFGPRGRSELQRVVPLVSSAKKEIRRAALRTLVQLDHD